jgi:outer membrane protein assembly factor BamD (BamD/ComL family)
MAAPTISLAVLGAVLLACVQGGCRAVPRPAARARAEHEPPVQQQQAYDAWRTAAHQVTCALYGLHAERLVQHREVGQVTLLEALARIDQMEQHDRDNPQTRALCATLRKLALLVYDYPAWTGYDAYVYAQQECLRVPPS